jgi:hypothetical protein
MKKFVFALFLFTFAFLAGCAETVTPVTTYGSQMVVEITLRGPFDISANRYFLVVSSNPSFRVPLPPPDDLNYEFIEPGSIPQQGSIADYYTNYYSTWSGYVVLDPAGYNLVPGPFIRGQATTREVVASLTDITSKLKFNFRLDRIFGAAIPDPIYFDFVSVAWPSGTAKFARDHLTTTNAYISSISGSTQTIPDENIGSLDPALDILNCTVSIQ